MKSGDLSSGQSVYELESSFGSQSEILSGQEFLTCENRSLREGVFPLCLEKRVCRAPRVCS